MNKVLSSVSLVVAVLLIGFSLRPLLFTKTSAFSRWKELKYDICGTVEIRKKFAMKLCIKILHFNCKSTNFQNSNKRVKQIICNIVIEWSFVIFWLQLSYQKAGSNRRRYWPKSVFLVLRFKDGEFKKVWTHQFVILEVT